MAVAVAVCLDGGDGLAGLLGPEAGSSGCGPRRIMVLLEKQVHLQKVGAAVVRMSVSIRFRLGRWEDGREWGRKGKGKEWK